MQHDPTITKRVKVTTRKFPDNDPGAHWTALIDGVPMLEFSDRDYTLWERAYGSPRSNAYGPIHTYHGPRAYARLTERQKLLIIREYVMRHVEGDIL
jgi:hypothetical protein